MAFTTAELLTSIKTKGQIPTSQQTFSAASMLALADDEIRVGLVPLILSVRESYFQAFTDTPIVDGTSRYPINPRAIGEKLKDLQLIDASGNSTDLSLIPVELLPTTRTTPSAQLEGFYFEGSDIVLVPTPSGLSGRSLRQYFYRRPGSLVATSAAGQITAIDAAARKVTVSALPSTFTTSRTYDFIQANPGFKTLGMDLVVSGISGTVLTFSAALPSELTVGDWVALAGESPIPQLPVEFHTILALRVAIAILRSLGHEKEADSKQRELDKIEERVLTLINPRIDGEPKKIIPTYGVLNPNGSVHPLFRY